MYGPVFYMFLAIRRTIATLKRRPGTVSPSTRYEIKTFIYIFRKKIRFPLLIDLQGEVLPRRLHLRRGPAGVRRWAKLQDQVQGTNAAGNAIPAVGLLKGGQVSKGFPISQIPKCVNCKLCVNISNRQKRTAGGHFEFPPSDRTASPSASRPCWAGSSSPSPENLPPPPTATPSAAGTGRWTCSPARRRGRPSARRRAGARSSGSAKQRRRRATGDLTISFFLIGDTSLNF